MLNLVYGTNHGVQMIVQKFIMFRAWKESTGLTKQVVCAINNNNKGETIFIDRCKTDYNK